jgi:hypothetical protein
MPPISMDSLSSAVTHKAIGLNAHCPSNLISPDDGLDVLDRGRISVRQEKSVSFLMDRT